MLLYFGTLLILSNDVELNPGPEQGTQLSSQRCYHTCSEQMEKGWHNIQCSLKANAAFLHHNLDHRLLRLEGLLNFMNLGINELKNITRENTNAINHLLSNQDTIMKRLQQAERDAERVEELEKQCNIKIHGLMESSDDCKDQVVNLLNHFSEDPGWNRSHIEKAYRVGKRNGSKGRTLVVTFGNLGDKLFVLRDKKMRDSLRLEGIKINSDLTTNQQAEVDYFRDQGLHVYYIRGRLQIEDKQGNKVDPSRFQSKQNSNAQKDYCSQNQGNRHNVEAASQPTNEHSNNNVNGWNYEQPAMHQFPPPFSFSTMTPPWLSGTGLYGPNMSQSYNGVNRQQNSLYPSLHSPQFSQRSPITVSRYHNSPYPTAPSQPHYHPTTEHDLTSGIIDHDDSSRAAFSTGVISYGGEPPRPGQDDQQTTQTPNPADNGHVDDVNDAAASQGDEFDDDDAFYNAIDIPNGRESRDVKANTERSSDENSASPSYADVTAATNKDNPNTTASATSANNDCSKSGDAFSLTDKQSKRQSLPSKIPTANRSAAITDSVDSAAVKTNNKDAKATKATTAKSHSSETVSKEKDSDANGVNVKQTLLNPNYSFRPRAASNKR